MRNLKTYNSFKTSPYQTAQERRSTIVYQPDDYTLALLISLPPKALRILLVMAARIDPQTGICYCPTKELKALFGWCTSSISKAKTDLIRAGLVAYGRANHSFYLNPKVFKPFHTIF